MIPMFQQGQIGLSVLGGSASADPDFGSVKLLMHMEGGTFVDSSSAGRTLTALSSAVTNTTQFKFGARSGDFTDAAKNARVTAGPATDLKLLNVAFCIDFFVYFTSVAAGNYFISAQGSGNLWFTIATGSKLEVSWAGSAYTSTTTLSAGQWYHVRFNKSGVGGQLRLFINGTAEAGPTNDSSAHAADATWSIGSAAPGIAGTGAGGRCYIDEFRLTIGASRGTTNFTPPTAAYPDA